MRIWDISEPIEEGTATFPGDTPFAREWVLRLDRGDSCNVSTIRFSAHLGTHTDAPLHFDDRGADIASVDLRRYCGRCRLLDLAGSGDPPLIAADTRCSASEEDRLKSWTLASAAADAGRREYVIAGSL